MFDGGRSSPGRAPVADAKRVCVTGVGAVSPYGRDAAAFWSGVLEGRSALGPITLFDASNGPVRLAGEARGYAPRDDMDAAAAAAMDRRALLASDAAIQAIMHADVPITGESVAQIGVIVGTELPDGYATTATMVARTLSAAGPVTQLSNGAAGGLMAVGEAAEWIRREECSIVIAGGAEAPVTAAAVAHYDGAGMLTHSAAAARAIRPYDAARDGFALSEGAAMLVVEDEEVAIRRGAFILAYVDGYGATFSRAPVAQPAPNQYDAGRAMQAALLKWDVTLQGEIDVIFGTAGGGAVDVVEAQAIRRIWGPNADKLWVTAIKGALGHTLGASGAFNALAAIYCLQAGMIPPVTNLETLDPACGELEVPRGEARRLHGGKALVNAFGIGHNASVIFSRP